MAELSFFPTPGTVYFIGAGPGAADLITVRGRDLIAQADLILYADSLVEESVAHLARKADTTIVGSSGLHLEQILALMVETARQGGVVARIHSGDPALYGAIHEQMAYLDDQAIPYEIVPGVTAAFAVAARLKTELTIPDVVQTIILTRIAHRTSMPERENLRALAAPGASLAIYLAITRIRQVVDDLLASGGYQPDTPVAVFHKVTWPDESYVLGTLADIAEKVRAAGYTKHALILVSPALETSLKSQTRRTSSHLYDKSYSHRFRQAEKMPAGRPQTTQNNPLPVVSGQSSAVVMAVTRRGSQLAAKLAVELPAELSIPAKFHSEIRDWRLIANLQSLISNFYPDSALDEVRRRWGQHRQLVLVMPTGVAVRAIAPLLNHKATDPAVVCLDEAGQSVIPLLGGHQAGANNLARQIAGLTGGYAAITTTSDVQGKPVLDRPPLLGERSCHIDPASALTPAIAALVNDEPLGVYLDPALTGLRPVLLDWLAGADNLTWLDNLDELMVDAYAAGLIFSHRRLSQRHQLLMGKSILYYPPVLVAGLGCRRGVPASELHLALETTLAEAGLASESLAALVTVDLKADESGLNQLAAQLGLPLQIVTGAQLTAWAEKLKTPASSFNPSSSSFFSPSAAQEKLGLPGVAEPCAIFAAGGELLVPKRSFARCTVAIALNEG